MESPGVIWDHFGQIITSKMISDHWSHDQDDDQDDVQDGGQDDDQDDDQGQVQGVEQWWIGVACNDVRKVGHQATA